jgi:aminoglycoside phosphotransferase (APT) family kinase protein
VLRRPPRGPLAPSTHDVLREARLLRALAGTQARVPRVLAVCADDAVVGAPFYVMERVAGDVVTAALPAALDTPAQRARCAEELVDALVEIHAVDWRACGLDGFSRDPGGYLERQLRRFGGLWRHHRTRDVPAIEAVGAWLAEQLPGSGPATVVHGDYRLGNAIFAAGAPARLNAILDWEMATLGDPLMELGSTLSYWVQADDDGVMKASRRQPTHLPGMLTRDEVVEYYSRRTGLTIDNWTFYEVYGLFRLAAVLQQIYFRFHHGETTNPAFADFWQFVGYLDWRCREVIKKGAS